jgi:hypothetical protein
MLIIIIIPPIQAKASTLSAADAHLVNDNTSAADAAVLRL